MSTFADTPSSQVARYFLKLGLTAFGGPAAHIAMMRQEVVEKRGWLTEQEFLDLLGMANMLPGPTSTEMAIFIGFKRAGWTGLVLAGVCFILPAMLIVLALAWAYVRYGTTAQATWLFYGIKPVVIAIVAQALWGLGSKAVKGVSTAIVGLGALGLYLAGVNVVAILVVGGLGVALAGNYRRLKPARAPAAILPLSSILAVTAGAVAPFSLLILFLTFLKIGAILYGSGYVLLAFLRTDFVTSLGWLTDRQLVDAIAIGQMTPGPVFTTATFIGYVLGGLPGAVLATLGIFLPSFVFVGIGGLVVSRVRNSSWFGAALDGVNVASLGLMAGVTAQLAQTSLIDPLTAAVALASWLLLIRLHTNTTWLIAGGAVIGVLASLANV